MNDVQALNNNFSLSNGELNKSYTIVEIKGDFKIKRRLLDFGFVNTKVIILHKSSLKGVYLLQIRGYVIALRQNQVNNIIVRE